MSMLKKLPFVFSASLVALALTCSTGCDNEKEIETPSGEVEVEREMEDGDAVYEVEED